MQAQRKASMAGTERHRYPARQRARCVAMAALIWSAGAAAYAHGQAAHGGGGTSAPAAPAARPAPAEAHGTHGGPEQTAWGIAGDPARVQRVIDIRMDDRMRFEPSRLTVREGETVRLRASNRGRLLHELVIGTPEELAKHARFMEQFPDMAHDEAYMAHVGPGARGEIVWHFNRAGDFEFACLIAGHFSAGMRGRITVMPARARKGPTG